MSSGKKPENPYIPQRINGLWVSLKAYYEKTGTYSEKQLAAIQKEQNKKTHHYFNKFDVTDDEYNNFIKTGKL